MSQRPSPRLLAICEAVRKTLEHQFPHRKGLRNLCSLSAIAVVRIARDRRINAEFIGGKFCTRPIVDKPQFGNPEHIKIARSPLFHIPHAWVKHRRNYIDLTLTQFDPRAPRVAVLPLDDRRYLGNPEPLEFAEMAGFLCGVSELDKLNLITEAKERLRG